MEVKLFEVRDRLTFMTMMAIELSHRGAKEAYLLRRAGFAAKQIDPLRDGSVYKPYVIFIKLEDVQAQYDPHSWDTARTVPLAHQYIIDNWYDLRTGQVIDIEHILGERPEPKRSEMGDGV